MINSSDQGGEHGNVPRPGVTANDAAARLRLLTDRPMQATNTEGIPVPPPAATVQDLTNRPLLAELAQVHDMQQTSIRRRAERAERSHKGKGGGTGEHRRSNHNGNGKGPDAVVHEYLGTNNEWTMCLEEFTHGEKVFRVTCNHVFHEECWNSMIFQGGSDHVECPDCRGPGIP